MVKEVVKGAIFRGRARFFVSTGGVKSEGGEAFSIMSYEIL